MNETIVFYTIHCPKCKVLQTIMNKKNIRFDIVDDKNVVIEIGTLHNIDSAPFAKINGEFYDTKKLQKWIEEQ